MILQLLVTAGNWKNLKQFPSIIDNYKNKIIRDGIGVLKKKEDSFSKRD